MQYEGAIYNVMSRGNGRAAVFPNDKDRTSLWRHWGGLPFWWMEAATDICALPATTCT
ncbi:MAG: hypothetical protein JWM16_2205 [Verrucomicrobiales bacterium]|nr:hypothetical protein [Verrucomicrobiales bacterium]